MSNKWYKRSSVLVPRPAPSTQLICLNVHEFNKPSNYTVILHFKMLQHVFLEIISLDAWIVALVDFGHLGKFWFMICVFSVCWRLQSIGIAEKNKLIWPGPFHEKWKVHATMMTMMMMMMTGIFTYGTNTYRYSFRRYSVRTPSSSSLSLGQSRPTAGKA